MSTIKDIHLPFRDQLQVASFRGALFHCEAFSRDSGRRIVTHEFPKKELPYSEDMGRRAKSFTVRAYCITYPYTMEGNMSALYNIDYRIARDNLINALDAYGPAMLVLPTRPRELVVCTRYRKTEEDRVGGYCTFDIDFVEFGLPPQYLTASQNTATVLDTAADVLRAQQRAGMLGEQPPTDMPKVIEQPPVVQPGG